MERITPAADQRQVPARRVNGEDEGERPSIDLQESILALLGLKNDPRSCDVAGLVTADMFDEAYRDIAGRLLDYRQQYGQAPGEAHIGDVFDDLITDKGNPDKAERYRRVLMNLVRLADGLDSAYVADRVIDWVKKQNVKALLFETAARIQAKEPIDEVIHEVQTSVSKIALLSAEGEPIELIRIFSPGLVPPEQALHGLAGEVVKVTGPTTEADPMAVLAQFLVTFGNCIGRRPRFRLGALAFHSNENLLVVGDTSRSRKGTSFDVVRDLFVGVDGAWLDRITGGLSSGEGLIWAVKEGRNGEVGDERLLCLATEFAAVLVTMQRQGNTLSTVLRDAWDGRPLRIMTKNAPASAPASHISVIAHITLEELRKHLDRTEMASGFANRFLFIAAKRSKVLPVPREPDQGQLGKLKDRLRSAIDWARDCGELSWTPGAVGMWARLYKGELSTERPGLVGHILARAEAHVLRLATIYSLLDCSCRIQEHHLKAALAVWRYAEASARAIFGNAIGDPVADVILRALREAGDKGMTRTEISDALGRHSQSWLIVRALETLLQHGLIAGERWPTGRAGRPMEVWRALGGEEVLGPAKKCEQIALGHPPNGASRSNGGDLGNADHCHTDHGNGANRRRFQYRPRDARTMEHHATRRGGNGLGHPGERR